MSELFIISELLLSRVTPVSLQSFVALSILISDIYIFSVLTIFEDSIPFNNAVPILPIPMKPKVKDDM
jgi:hypothetical protein